MPLPLDDYVTHIRNDGPALADAAGRDLNAAVPGCPGWTTTDLLRLVGQVHQWVRAIVRNNLDAPLSRDALPAPPAGAALVDWFATGAEELASALEEVDPGGLAWNWSGEHLTVDWWHRRMAQETAIHRWDAQQAIGAEPAPVDAAFAVDGVDELFDVILTRMSQRTEQGPYPPTGATLHLHATDADGEWLLHFSGSTVDVSRGHAKGDAALRGPASDLLLFLWKRITPTAPAFEVFGDASVLDNWIEQTRI
jgi:uncharacterized protein (TIGR03083 family)